MTEPVGRPNLYGLPRPLLAERLAALDAAPFRAGQVLAALYRRDVLDPEAWTELPAALRRSIAESFSIARPQIAARALARDQTLKLTLSLPSGGEVEAVAIREPTRTTLCVSSQVGCAFGCTFCMTGRLGFRRHLSAGEIVGQVAALRSATGIRGEEHNVVFMGMGEPLHNYDAVLEALKLLLDREGFALGPRRITISTVGLPDQIRDLAERRLAVRLAVSLVAADQELRAQLTPAAARHSLPELAAAVRRFGAGRRDRPTLEVVLLDGVNDSVTLARRLATFARLARAKVNLIEFNPAGESPHRPASEARIQLFLRLLRDAGVFGAVRRSRGRDACAACGQLAFLTAAPAPPAAP